METFLLIFNPITTGIIGIILFFWAHNQREKNKLADIALFVSFVLQLNFLLLLYLALFNSAISIFVLLFALWVCKKIGEDLPLAGIAIAVVVIFVSIYHKEALLYLYPYIH